jgi:YVTN family beta-propeller protein
VRERIVLGESPEGTSLSRDGALMAAASEIANGVVLLETGGAKRKWTIAVPGKNPEHAVFSPDGRWLFVSAEEGAQVDVIDVARKAVAGSVPVGRRPRGIAFAPDGHTAMSRSANCRGAWWCASAAAAAGTTAGTAARRSCRLPRCH